jgi:DNA-binding NarL/FixJ family response regulator
MSKKNQGAVAARTKVLIVDDHPVVREGLVMNLATQPELEVCGEAEDLAGALAMTGRMQKQQQEGDPQAVAADGQAEEGPRPLEIEARLGATRQPGQRR